MVEEPEFAIKNHWKRQKLLDAIYNTKKSLKISQKDEYYDNKSRATERRKKQ